MRQKPGTRKSHGEKVVKDIRRATLGELGAANKTADYQVAQKPRRDFAPPVPTTRTRDAAVQVLAKCAEIHRTVFALQSVQPLKVDVWQRHLKADAHRCFRREAPF